MNNSILGEAMPKTNPRKSRRKRKNGELAKFIIMLMTNERTRNKTLTEIANDLECTHENVRLIFKKIKENPEEEAVKSGYDPEKLKMALMKREEVINTGVRSFYSHWPGKKSEWRGRGDWPATKTATKTSITNKEIAMLSIYGQDNENRKYVAQDRQQLAGIPASIAYKDFEDTRRVKNY